MRNLLILLLSLSLGFVGCSSADKSSDSEAEAAASSPTDSASANELDSAAPESEAPTAADTSEADLAQADLGGEQPPPPSSELPPATEEPPLPEQAASEPPPPEPAPETPAPDGPEARITALNFDANMNGGTVLIKTSAPVQYTTRTGDDGKQFIIELQNTTVPKKFTRPYVTKEFNSAIASINAYQAKGAFKVARVVVQMREAGQPGIAQDGNLISVNGSGSEGAATEVAQQDPPAPAVEEEEPTVAEDESDTPVDPRALSAKSIDDFLLGNTKFYGRKISLEVKDADIRDVFRFISEESGLNIVVAEDVTGKVSLKLKKIPWDQALTVLLQSRQLGYVKQGSILRIAALKSLRAESDSAREVIDAQKQLKPIRVQIFPVSYAKADELELQAKEFLSSRGKVKADKRTNSLVVSDIDESIQKIKRLIGRLDTQTPQVLIEARIVEARESFNRAMGVKWTASGDPVKMSSRGSNGAPINLTPSLGFGGAAQTGGNLDFGLKMGTFDLLGDIEASLKLLEVEKLVKVISAPRIVTLDRQDANIEQTTQFPIFNTITDSTGKAQTNVTFQDVRLQLKVTPQITAGGSVIMSVLVAREFPDAAETGANDSKARAVNKRKAETQVLVENGDTVVIGGIFQSDVTDSESGVPGLRKIPILGALFKSKEITREKNELVIFLTPRILNKEQAFVKPEEGEGT